MVGLSKVIPFSLNALTRWVCCALTAILITGCGSFAALSVGAGAMPVTKRPQYDSPQQVIYRVDEHRYITLENYKDCRVGGIMKWHDETRGIHEVVEEHPTWGSGVWPGRFSMEPGGDHLMIPTYGCGDRSCNLFINYSNDGGRTWSYFGSWKYSMWAYKETDSDYQLVRQTTVRVTKDGYAYITKPNYSTVTRYHNGSLGSALREERCSPPPELRGDGKSPDYEHIEARAKFESECKRTRKRTPPFPPLREGSYDTYDLGAVPDVHTPSGQDRFTCDPSLNPVIENTGK
jgi:hypothetical protein